MYENAEKFVRKMVISSAFIRKITSFLSKKRIKRHFKPIIGLL